MNKLNCFFIFFMCLITLVGGAQDYGIYSEDDVIIDGDPAFLRFYTFGSAKGYISHNFPDLIIQNTTESGRILLNVNGGTNSDVELQSDGTLRAATLEIDPRNSTDSKFIFASDLNEKYTLRYNTNFDRLELDAGTLLGVQKIDRYGNQSLGSGTPSVNFRTALTSPSNGLSTRSSGGGNPAAMLKLTESVATRFGRIHFNNSFDEYWQIQARATNTDISEDNDQDPEMRFYYYDQDDGGGRTVMSMDGDDNQVGINRTNPEAHLHIKQNVANEEAFAMENDGDGNDIWAFEIGTDDLDLLYNGTVVGTFDNTGGSYTTSDRRLKDKIESMPEKTLEQVLQLKPASYRYRHAAETLDKSLGFIAQEVKPVFPDVVGENETTGYLMLKYDEFIPILTKAIQELNEKVEAQEREIERLKEKLGEG